MAAFFLTRLRNDKGFTYLGCQKEREATLSSYLLHRNGSKPGDGFLFSICLTTRTQRLCPKQVVFQCSGEISASLITLSCSLKDEICKNRTQQGCFITITSVKAYFLGRDRLVNTKQSPAKKFKLSSFPWGNCHTLCIETIKILKLVTRTRVYSKPYQHATLPCSPSEGFLSLVYRYFREQLQSALTQNSCSSVR